MSVLVPTVDLRPDHWEIVRSALRRHVPDREVVAFGSRATWTAKDYSDLDLAIMGEEPLPLRTASALSEAFGDSDLPFRVDIVDWARTDDGFRAVIRRDGVPFHASHGGRYGTSPAPASDWLRCTVAEACSAIDYGLTKAASDRSSGQKFLRITDIVSGQINWNTVPYVTVGSTTAEKYGLRHDDIVLARTGASTGVSAYIKNPPPSVFASYLVRLRARPGFDGRFLAYYLRSELFRRYMRGVLGDKSAQPNASATTMTAAPFRAPRDPREQRAIAHILGTLDDKIELSRRMNETLEAMARALFKSWFVDFDPVRAKMEGRDTGLPRDIADLFPDRFVDSEIGEIPEGWAVGQLADAIELLSGGTPRTTVAEYWNGEIPWYTPRDAPNQSDVFVLDTQRTITQVGVDNSATKVLPSRTTVISARGTVGRLACLGRPMAMNQTCYGIRGADGYNDFFTYWLVRNAVEELRNRTHGTVFDTITRQTFAFIDTHLPPNDVAGAFEAAVKAIMERVLGNLHESRTLARLRDILLPKLISGEIRVPDAERALESAI